MARADAVPLPSPAGKQHGDENFPVASLLLSSSLRPKILAFYRFARAADDIADAPDLDSTVKLQRLDEFERGLSGLAGAPRPWPCMKPSAAIPACSAMPPPCCMPFAAMP